MDDKFIMMGLDDERSKKVAEVLGNKTCKKILDYLADNKEASEKDIADALGIPINTAEYNLKKLLETGLVEKAKNFFWSKKGRKIDMYKIAKKHIVISPKSKPTLTALKTIIPVLMIIAFALIAVLLFVPKNQTNQFDSNDIEQSKLKQFNSQTDLNNYLKLNSENYEVYSSWSGGRLTASMGMEISKSSASVESDAPSAGASDASASDYSTTNIQVKGVDEADIVKNDGKYIYSVSGNKVIITKAYPASELENISEIELQGINGIFVNGDKLIVFSSDYGYNRCVYDDVQTGVATKEIAPCYNSYNPSVLVSVYNIEDRENPVLETNLSVEGNYIGSRMIDNYIYLIGNKYVDSNNPEPPIYIMNGVENKIGAEDVYYWDYPDYSYVFTSITALDIDNGEYDGKVYLTGYSNNIYVSKDNIYFTTNKRISYNSFVNEYADIVAIPLLPSKESEIEDILKSDYADYKKMRELQEIIYDYSYDLKGSEKEDFDKSLMEKLEKFNEQVSKEMEKIIVHKIAINGKNIEYKTQGEVSGYLLNQFSMDENNGNLRVATTTGNWRGASLNHLYILDKDLKLIGSVEDLAKGERIYSVRFLGDRAYMVTFRQVDPLFVIDVSNPEAPEVLGYLKVTGYSSYLHPYDENLLIGIGKEADENGRVQGLKIALFDVSDVKNPVEKAKYEVGKEWSDTQYSWSDSNALYEHKAFLFDKERNLLVIPVSYNKMYEDYSMQESFNGAFIFNINENSISLRGKISHNESTSWNWYYGPYAVQRSLFMDDVLYTISNAMIKANDLNDLTEINKLELPNEEQRHYYGNDGIETGIAVAE